MRRATQGRNIGERGVSISIHALREESDPLKYIYPHLPYKFQSTLSVRRATGVTAFNFCLSLISIHALREESDKRYNRVVIIRLCISIHALREESDRPLFISNSKRNISIHALREESDATPFSLIYYSAQISIHALREESDFLLSVSVLSSSNFNPRSP